MLQLKTAIRKLEETLRKRDKDVGAPEQEIVRMESLTLSAVPASVCSPPSSTRRPTDTNAQAAADREAGHGCAAACGSIRRLFIESQSADLVCVGGTGRDAG